MENSIERPIRITAKVCFEKVEYNEKNKEFKADGNKKGIPQYGIEMPEGEVSIPLGNCIYQKDENGKIKNVQFLNKEVKEVEEQSI